MSDKDDKNFKNNIFSVKDHCCVTDKINIEN